MRHALIITALIGLALFLANCSGSAPQFNPGDGAGKTAGKIAPVMTFVYQGGPISKDARGGGGPAIGFGPALYAGLTHVGVRMDRGGQFPPEQGGRHYVQEIRDSLGAGIVAVIETPYDPGRKGNIWGMPNLGKVLTDYASHDQPGEFIRTWLDSLVVPCLGVAFDVEYPIMDRNLYQPTKEDTALAKIWNYDLRDRDQFILSQCRKVATILRLMFREAQLKFPDCQIAIAYSGYGGADYSPEGDVRASYGCDWQMMIDPNLTWRGEPLPPITHGQVAWHTSVELTPGILNWIKSLPPTLRLLHTIQPGPSWADSTGFANQIENRLRQLRPNSGDGIGLVQLGDQWKFDTLDSLAYQSLGDALRRHGFK